MMPTKNWRMLLHQCTWGVAYVNAAFLEAAAAEAEEAARQAKRREETSATGDRSMH